MKQKRMYLSKLPIKELVSRAFLIDVVREMSLSFINKTDKEFVKEYTEIDDEDNEKEVLELNLEFLIFTAPVLRIVRLVNKYRENVR